MRKRFYKGSVRSVIRTRVLDDAKCEGVTHLSYTVGVKNRWITQPSVIVLTVLAITGDDSK